MLTIVKHRSPERYINLYFLFFFKIKIIIFSLQFPLILYYCTLLLLYCFANRCWFPCVFFMYANFICTSLHNQLYCCWFRSVLSCSIIYRFTMAQSSLVNVATNNFAVDLHKTLSQSSSENLFYSPASIVVALAMTYVGTRGNTAKQMADTFHFKQIPDATFSQQFQHFLQALNGSNTKGNEILMANRLFAQDGFGILEQFQQSCKEGFGAEVALVDYVKNAIGAREEVNKWVEGKTKNKIQDLIPEDMFTADTRLTLVNAVYFKGSWMRQFKSDHTNTGPFQVTASQEIQVEMMFQSDEFRYAENGALQCQMLELPYADEKLSMIVLLPNELEGLKNLESSLTFEVLNQAITDLKKSGPQDVEVTLPKFKLTQEFSLGKVLSQMGASDMFTPGVADLSGIADAALAVSEVVHKAFVDVNEEGTEAAAATAVGIMLMSMPMNPEFNANHPFLFLIHHNDTGAILFFGRVVKPTESKN